MEPEHKEMTTVAPQKCNFSTAAATKAAQRAVNKKVFSYFVQAFIKMMLIAGWGFVSDPQSHCYECEKTFRSCSSACMLRLRCILHSACIFESANGYFKMAAASVVGRPLDNKNTCCQGRVWHVKCTFEIIR